MSRPTATLTPLGLASDDAWADVRWSLEGDGFDGFVMRHGVDVSHAAWLPDAPHADHALSATLLWAMREGRDLIVRGSVSPRLLDGAQLLQEIWHRWRPATYRVVDIRVESERELHTDDGQDGGLFAFSGGVDATFTLFRHLGGHAGRWTRHAGAALLVHGLDIPIERGDFYDEATARAHRMLDGTHVPLVRLRTNSRKITLSWPDENGLQLIACLQLLQKRFDSGVRGSGEAYEALVMPWGSTPMTDHLGSTGRMRIDHDGAHFDRTEKVDWLARHTAVCTHLRVCWAGPHLGRNCGACEKCLRTMLNFWASGHAVPDAFPARLTPASVIGIRVKNTLQLGELQGVLRHAQGRHSPHDPLLRALRLRLSHPRIAALARRVIKRLPTRRPKGFGAGTGAGIA